MARDDFGSISISVCKTDKSYHNVSTWPLSKILWTHYLVGIH